MRFAFTYFNRAAYGLSDEALKHVKKGVCLLILENRQEAINEFKKSLGLEPSAVGYFLTALGFEHSNRHDSAYANYNIALKFDNEIFDAHKKRGIYRSELKDWKGAALDFEEMARIEPSLKITYRLRGLVRLKFNDYYGTILDMSRYLKMDTTDYEIWYTRASCRKAVKDYNGAIEDYNKALELSPREKGIYEFLTETYLYLNDTANVLQTINKCDSVSTLTVYLTITKIRILIAQSQFSAALNELKKTYQGRENGAYFHQDISVFLFLEGWMFFRQRNYKDSLKKLDKAIQTFSSNREARYLRSKIFLIKGNKAEAVEDLQKLSEIDYRDSKALLTELLKR